MLVLTLLAPLVSMTWAQEPWVFDPEEDSFDNASLLDLRHLNEEIAGQTGWIQATSSGDFALGSGEPVRFWATNTGVARDDPFRPRPKPGWQTAPDLQRHARWLAKRGVNMIRLHTHINPDPATQAIDEVNEAEVDWIWRVVAAMKQEGIYTVVSPYWVNTMESDDARWGTQWGGKHYGLLFFDETLQAAYKEWLRFLFTTPTDHLDGGTLADEPALAVFQLQNEDSLLFWTVGDLSDSSRHQLQRLFYEWTVEKYGSIDEAYELWGSGFSEGDDPATNALGLSHIWNLTSEGRAAVGESPRLDDQLQFYVETMIDFNSEMVRFIREELGCPVLVNAGNWKTADVVYLEDAERYSYSSSTDVVALNRYFAGVHAGPDNGWAVRVGDRFTNPSVLSDSPLDLPVSVKQPAGKPTLVTESVWVMPMDTAFEAPMLVSAYSSLSGFDGYFWFAAETEGFVPPRSANGYNDAQEKWICMTPDMAGQWPAAALAFRKGYISQGQPVVQEHRSLSGMWQRKSPLIAESASFDPNRDSGDLAPDSALTNGVDPLAFLVGPVSVQYDSSESNSSALPNLEQYIERTAEGERVTSVTGELALDSAARRFTIDAPHVQALITYGPASVELSDVAFDSSEGDLAATAISLDGRPLASSTRVLVQLGARARPTGWVEEPAEIGLSTGDVVAGRRVANFGGPPWMVESKALTVRVSNPLLQNAYALDANGMPVEELPLDRQSGAAQFAFPDGVLYVALVGKLLAYADWRAAQPWLNPAEDGAETEDPDGDGLSNLLEFSAGSDPLRPDPRAGLEAPGFDSVAGGGARAIELRFRRNTLAGGIGDTFDLSRDLVNWTPLGEAIADAGETTLDPDSGGDGEVNFRALKVPLGQTESSLFLRRRVEQSSED